MITLPDTVFITFGVVVAAIIAGVFSYINLVSVKESKISEFRQNWINELRKEIASYISSVRGLIQNISNDNYGKGQANSMAAKFNHAELYNEVLNSKTSILLRINDKEEDPKKQVINDKCLVLVEEIYNDFEGAKFGLAEEKIESLIENSRKLLKYEWNRARDGEKAYTDAKKNAVNMIRVSKYLLIAFPIIVIGLFIIEATSNTQKLEGMPKNEALNKEKQLSKQECDDSLKSPVPQAEPFEKLAAPQTEPLEKSAAPLSIEADSIDFSF